MLSPYEPWRDAAELRRNSVYQTKPNAPSPSVLYVHYIAKIISPYPVYRFDHAGPIANIQQAVDDAVRVIQGPGKNPEPYIAGGGVAYDRPSYAVFVLAPSQGKLVKGDGVRMWHEHSKKNHSFFSGDDLNDVHGCSAMYCINFRKNLQGDALKAGDKERFRWRINHAHAHVHQPMIKSFLKLFFYTHENSGTNMGP